MSLLTEAGPRPATPARHGKRLRLRLLLALLGVVITAAGLAPWLILRHFDEKYGPIDAGGFGGVYQNKDWVPFNHGSGVRLPAHSGARGQLIESLANRGSHSVKVSSVDGNGAVVRIRWSTYRFREGALIPGRSADWREFPAIVPAHGTIRLLVTIRRPRHCPPPSHGVTFEHFYRGAYEVHWESLVGAHTTTIRGTYATGDTVRDC